MTPEQFHSLLEAPEGSNLEFKSAAGGFHFEKLVDYCVAIANEGGVANIIEHIALNAQQFSLEDTPETVNKEALRPTACAFVDLIGRLDAGI